MNRLRVLFTSAGRRVELIRCFRRDAALLGLDLVAVAADMNPEMSAACSEADVRFKVPPAVSSEYIAALAELCSNEEIDLLVPTIDTELEPLSRSKPMFAAAGTRVVISSPEVIQVARDKHATANRLRAAGLSTPATFPAHAVPASFSRELPAILKPVDGSSSHGIRRAPSLRELNISPDDHGSIVQRLIAGPEYSINIFFDREGRPRCAVPHRRLSVRAGEVEKGIVERLEQVSVKWLHSFASALPGAEGPVCVQGIVDSEGDLSIFEINARFGGGFPLSHYAGAEFPKWLLQEHEHGMCDANDNWKDGVAMTRYDAAFFRSPDGPWHV